MQQLNPGLLASVFDGRLTGRSSSVPRIPTIPSRISFWQD